MEASLYIVDCGSKQNADTLRNHWLEGAVPVNGGPQSQLLAPLTDNQVYGLQRDHGFTVTRAPAAT